MFKLLTLLAIALAMAMDASAQTICNAPAASAGFKTIIDGTLIKKGLNYDNRLVGTCNNCGNTTNLEYFFSSLANAQTNGQSPVIFTACPSSSTICVVDEGGNEFNIYGNQAIQIQIHPYCDQASNTQDCHNYALINCPNPSDPNSGITSGLYKWSCAKQYSYQGGNVQPFGLNSGYVKAVSMSCGGCSTLIQSPCEGPYEPKTPFCLRPPQTTVLKTYIDGQVTQAPNYNTVLNATCPNCGNNLTSYYFNSLASPLPWSAVESPVFFATCSNQAQFCAIDEGGNTYQFYGSQTIAGIGIYPFCDNFNGGSYCSNYILMYCTSNSQDANSGLSTANYQWSCQTESNDVAANVPFGSGSRYLRFIAVGCNGCAALQGSVCSGPMLPVLAP